MRKAAASFFFFVYPNRNFRLLGDSYYTVVCLALIGPEIIDEGMYSRDDTRSVMRERDASDIVSLPLLVIRQGG